MTHFDKTYTEFLNTYETQATIIKRCIVNHLFEKRLQNAIPDERYCAVILQTILNFHLVINDCFKGVLEEDVVKIIEVAQKHELAALYKVKTVEDLKNYRTKILTELR